MGGIFNFRTMAMQLEEQFKVVTWNKTHNANCAKIAENFAIGFAEWYEMTKNMNLDLYLSKTARQLLEIYKKTL